MHAIKTSFAELDARERVFQILDEGSFRELLDPFEGFESPHLENQGIVPQSDDGVVVAKGKIEQRPAVVISIEGHFQGGGIGEVSGAKIAGALELALRDQEVGIPTLPVLVYDTGGVRLQEANYGLLAIAEIGAAISALRQYTPVIGIIPGKIGCFGGMSLTAGLCSALIMTKEGRLTLNGPEVIEQEAGIEEFDSKDRKRIWKTIGGEQRFFMGFVDELVDDDVEAIKKAIQDIKETANQKIRSKQVVEYRSRIQISEPYSNQSLEHIQMSWQKADQEADVIDTPDLSTEDLQTSRGGKWFLALAGAAKNKGIPSVLCADKKVDGEDARFISVIPNQDNRFPRARKGEVGLEEGWAIAHYVREAIEQDKDGPKRAIIAIVDAPSQAYGYNEEFYGLHLAGAAAVDAYAEARRLGHPVITLIVGKAISGAFLTHGLQSNRILALNDEGVNVHVMSKQSAARITRRTVQELEEATKRTPAMAYDISSFATLGALHELIDGVDADAPKEEDIQRTQKKLKESIMDARLGLADLSNRLGSTEAKNNRTASIQVRERLATLW